MRPLFLLETLLDSDIGRWTWSELQPLKQGKIKWLCIIKLKKIWIQGGGRGVTQKGEKEEKETGTEPARLYEPGLPL